MQYKNISKRTIRVVNVILKPNEIASFPENSAHVKTFLRMNWLTAIEEAPKLPVVEAPVVIEAPPVVEEVPVVEAPAVESPVADASVVDEMPAPEVAPEVAPEDEHKRGRGRKGK